MSKIYTLEFSSIQNTQGTVCFTDHARDQQVNVSINIDDTGFQCRLKVEYPSKIADLIDLAVAIHGSDRLVKQPFDQPPCQIKVILPVRNPDLLNSKLFQEKLEKLMHWATGSNWCFSFTKRDDQKRSAEENTLFDLPIDVNEVALWSGGLDALAGLYNRICDAPNGLFILCGSGSNDNIIFKIQKQTFNAIEFLFPNRLKLYGVPIRFSNSKKCPKNPISRSRGIVFTLIGSACAYLMGKRVLNVYENGIGAINLPYRDSALGLDHTRSVHPRTLVMVSELISILWEESFKIENPFLFWTKAQMCQVLFKNQAIDLAFLTKSCDQPLRKNPSQCGYCSSCLIRKQSLVAAEIEDKTKYYISHASSSIKQDYYLYLNNILEQVKTLYNLLNISDEFEQQWNAMTNQYPQLDYEILDYLELTYHDLSRNDIRDSLLNLYRNYIGEWNRVKSKVQATIEDYNHDE